MATSTLTVRQTRTSRDTEDFLKLPWSLYARDPNWVPPLLAEVRTRLSKKKNPYFQHADAAMFLAQRDGETVGRISAQVCQLAQVHQRAGDGHFGFFECEDNQETADALFDAAASWLVDHGMDRMVGPFNLSINEETGLLVDGFHRPPFIFMGHNLPRYDRHFRDYGLAKEMDLYAYYLDLNQPYTPRVQRIIESIHRNKMIRLRNVDRHCVEKELAVLMEIFNEAWSDNWGYIPMTEAEVKDLAMLVKRLFDTNAILLAEIDDEVAGFIVVIPNLNEMTSDLNGKLLPFGWLRLLLRLKFSQCNTVRVPLMGIRKKYHGTRTGAAIAFSMIDRCRQSNADKGVTHCEMSWILESNTAMRGILDALGSTLDKTYRIYAKSIGA